MSRLTVDSYLEEVKEVNDILYPLFQAFQKKKVAALLNIKFDTLIKRMENYSMPPADLATIIEFYSDDINEHLQSQKVEARNNPEIKMYSWDKAEALKYIVTDKYDLVEKCVSDQIKNSGVAYKFLSNYTGINYNIIMQVMNRGERWGLTNLRKIGDYFDYLSNLKYLLDEGNTD